MTDQPTDTTGSSFHERLWPRFWLFWLVVPVAVVALVWDGPTGRWASAGVATVVVVGHRADTWRSADTIGLWLWNRVPTLYLTAAVWLLALDLGTDQPARGWAQAGVTAVMSALFTIGFRADMRRRYGPAGTAKP